MIPRSESSKYRASERMLHTKLSLQYFKKKAHAARRKNAGGVSRSANDHASCKQAKCVLSSCHHSHWVSDALIVDDLDGRLVACQSVNT